ncbi:MAG: hypothetical protein ACT4PT_03795, partial [Methanobacteriota archaeon]
LSLPIVSGARVARIDLGLAAHTGMVPGGDPEAAPGRLAVMVHDPSDTVVAEGVLDPSSPSLSFEIPDPSEGTYRIHLAGLSPNPVAYGGAVIHGEATVEYAAARAVGDPADAVPAETGRGVPWPPLAFVLALFAVAAALRRKGLP